MRRLLVCLTWVLCGCGKIPVPIPAPTPAAPFQLALKGVWYRPARSSFVAELSDTGSLAQQDATADLAQNFAAIRAIGANVAVVSLPDNDDWPGQFAGGAPYDPMHHPRNVTQAEGLILDAADTAGLKIVFVLSPSSYHTFSSDADGNPGGAFDYFNQFTVDPRVIGWMLHDECDPSNPAQQAFLKKYWDFFYERFHSATAWVAINTQYTPDFINVIRPMIDAEKAFFAGTTHKPDLWGMEWFADDPQQQADIQLDIASMVDWMAGDAYPVPRYQIAFMSGGSTMNQATFYPAAIEAIASAQVAGVFVWLADSYANADCATTLSAQPAFDLFTGAFMPRVTCAAYTLEPWHWESSPNMWTLETNTFRTQSGRYSYNGLTAAGQAIQNEFRVH